MVKALFKHVLIANRGEIAIRVARACEELGIRTLAVYSDADKKSFYYRIADSAVSLPGTRARDTYLNVDKLLQVAKENGCDAVHPGYGFLSENADFVSACESAGIKFIGPSGACMRKVADKAHIKKVMGAAGVPIIPSVEDVADMRELRRRVREMGFPVIVKPSFGGGGKGMRVVRSEEELESAAQYANTIGKSAFGDAAFYVEKCLDRSRHIEVQLLADSAGTIISLGERECSIQRSHQKLIEESPSPALTQELREQVIQFAKRAAAAVGYENAGTIEFLYWEGNFYFLEVNARIQVEHTVTELVTGMDLIKEQVRIAAGELIEGSNESMHANGWAIQCRINAEDPYNKFAPSPGKILGYRAPGGLGVRVDTGIFMGYAIPTQYDSMVSKLSVWGRNRQEALHRMRRVLNEYVILGIKTTLPLHRAIFREKNFVEGNYDTHYIEEHSDDLIASMRHIERSERIHDELLSEVFLNDSAPPNPKPTSETSRLIGAEISPLAQQAQRTSGKSDEHELAAIIGAALAIASNDISWDPNGPGKKETANPSQGQDRPSSWAAAGRMAQMNRRLAAGRHRRD